MTSVLVDRAQFANRTGLSFFDPKTGWYKRDMFQALGYQVELEPKHYRDRYERGGIAERIVEAYPRATWAGGAYLRETDDEEVETPFEEAAGELFKRLDAWQRFLRADILAGLGRYAVLLIGAPGKLVTELPRMRGPEDVLYLTPLPEDRAKIKRLVDDPQDERFGLPEVYQLTLGSQAVTQAGVSVGARNLATADVHWTRVVHVSEGLLDDDVFGKPRLRAVWNYLDDLAKIVGGGAEAAWRRMDPGMHIDQDPETAEMDQTQKDALTTQIDEYDHGLRRWIRTQGFEIKPLSASVSAFGGNVDSLAQLISGATGIPQRIFLGSERGELASTQDRSNWKDRIVERRRELASPTVRQLVDRLVDHGALPEPAEYEVTWPDVEDFDEQEKAGIAATLANANAAQKNANNTILITHNEIRARVFDLAPLVPEDLPQPPEPPPPPVTGTPPPGAEAPPPGPPPPAGEGAAAEGEPPKQEPPVAVSKAASQSMEDALVELLAIAIERGDQDSIVRVLFAQGQLAEDRAK